MDRGCRNEADSTGTDRWTIENNPGFASRLGPARTARPPRVVGITRSRPICWDLIEYLRSFSSMYPVIVHFEELPFSVKSSLILHYTGNLESWLCSLLKSHSDLYSFPPAVPSDQYAFEKIRAKRRIQAESNSTSDLDARPRLPPFSTAAVNSPLLCYRFTYHASDSRTVMIK